MKPFDPTQFKAAIKQAIAKAKSPSEVRKLTKLNYRILNGTMDQGDLIVAWLDAKLTTDPARIPKARSDKVRGTHAKANT